MRNDDFLVQLPDAIEKNRIIEQSRITRKELEDSTIPVFRTAGEIFNSFGLKGADTQALQKIYERLAHRKSSIIVDIAQALPNLEQNLEELESYINKTFNSTIVKANISLKEINVLQFVGVAGFVSSYARRLLAFFYSVESAEFKNTILTLSDSLSKAEISWIKDNFLDFVNAFGALTVKTDNLEKLLKTIPDIEVSPSNIQSVASVQTNSRVDPLGLQNFNVTNNFVYRLMLRFATYQADRYKVALEERKMLELRALLLKRQREDKADARLEKEIAITEDRISKLNYRIRKMEED